MKGWSAGERVTVLSVWGREVTTITMTTRPFSGSGSVSTSQRWGAPTGAPASSRARPARTSSTASTGQAFERHLGAERILDFPHILLRPSFGKEDATHRNRGRGTLGIAILRQPWVNSTSF